MREISENDIADNGMEAFTRLVKSDLRDGAIDFSTLQEPRYMKYWQHLTMVERDEDDDAYRFFFVGTQIVRVEGEEFTGMTSREIWADDTKYHTINGMYDRIFQNREIVFSTGIVELEGKEFIHWNAGSFPLRKPPDQPLCVTYLSHIQTAKQAVTAIPGHC